MGQTDRQINNNNKKKIKKRENKKKENKKSNNNAPVAIESAGTWNHQAVELVQKLGRRMTAVTEDTREATYLFQRMSVALQRGNAVSFHSTFTTE